MEKLEFYTDYRKFLQDYFEERKQQNRYYSYRTFCQLAGLTSPSLFKEVVSGKRNLTGKSLAAFIRGLKLNDRQAKFFMALVNFTQAKSDKEKQHYLEQMQGLKSAVDQKIIPATHYEYYSKWYHAAIRELCCAMEWNEDFQLLAKALRPQIKMSEARESVKLLFRLGLIEKTPKGYVQKNPAITTGAEVRSLAVRKLNHTLAGLGQTAVDGFSPADRDISSIIMGVSGRSMDAIKREILEFRRRIINIVSDDRVTDRVYNLNIQFFPLSGEFENQTSEHKPEVANNG